MAPLPRLMLVTNRRRSRRPLPELVAAAVVGGVDAIQLREPDLEAAELLPLAAELQAVIAGRATLLINRHLEIAAQLGVGLHLPEACPDAVSARRQLGPGALLGRSIHTPAAAAEATGVDYLLAGHVFPTASKPGKPALGPAGLQEIVAATRLPVLAIGGITADRVGSTLAAGAVGIAVIGAIADADDPERAALDLRTAVDRAWEQRMDQTASVATATTIDLTVNGKPATVAADATITDFLTGKGLTASMVIVELNGEIIPRAAYPTTRLAAGDRMEVVHAVGGG